MNNITAANPNIREEIQRILLRVLFIVLNGRPGGNRTHNLRFWRPPLCQLSYRPLRSPKYITLFPKSYERILRTIPAPTVLPPSRTAKLNPSSIAIGAISSQVNSSTVSPGITISTPSGRLTSPVTSVVLK